MTHYSRSEWGGRPPKAGRTRLDPQRVQGIALHWPAMTGRLTTVDQVKAALRSWQAYHMDTRGWSDIAYQVAIDQAGNTYGLRGLRIRSGANGDQDVNERFGALLLVLAEGEEPSPELIRAVQGRVRRHRELFPRSKRVVGHSDIRPEPTACPGPAVMELIRAGKFNPPKRSSNA